MVGSGGNAQTVAGFEFGGCPMIKKEIRPYWKEIIRKTRQGKKISPLLKVTYKGQIFDQIIAQWAKDLEVADRAIGRAIGLRSRMAGNDWTEDNDDYIALCKWIETGLDGLRQWNSESGYYPIKPQTLESGVLDHIAAQLDWKQMNTVRNNLTHSILECDPSEVQLFADEVLPDLRTLLGLIRIHPQTVKYGSPIVAPVYEHGYLREITKPLDMEEGARFEIGSCVVCISYDDFYVPRIIFVGHDSNGHQWNGTLHNEHERLGPMVFVPCLRT